MNTKPTSEVIRQAAKTIEEYSKRMNKLADDMDRTEDLSYCGEALSMVINMLSNIRIDLFSTRPIREYERTIARMEKSK